MPHSTAAKADHSQQQGIRWEVCDQVDVTRLVLAAGHRTEDADVGRAAGVRDLQHLVAVCRQNAPNQVCTVAYSSRVSTPLSRRCVSDASVADERVGRRICLVEPVLIGSTNRTDAYRLYARRAAALDNGPSRP